MLNGSKCYMVVNVTCYCMLNGIIWQYMLYGSTCYMLVHDGSKCGINVLNVTLYNLINMLKTHLINFLTNTII